MDSALVDPVTTYGELLGGLQCGALLLDRAGIIHAVNERLCRMLHRTEEQVVGRPLFSFYHSEDSIAFLKERLAAFDEPYEGEFFVPDGNGGQKPIILSGRLLGAESPLCDYR